MSEADGKGPTIVTKKWKRRSGFRYSTKKVLERSKLSREIAKDRVPELGSVRKALTYPSELWSDIGIIDQLGQHPFTQLMKIKKRGLMQALGISSRLMNVLIR
jgi:hypothetical protein